MERTNKKKITQSDIFALSLVSSIVFFITVAYLDTLFSSLWVLALAPLLISFLLYVTGIVLGIIFLYNRRTEYTYSFVPISVNAFFLILIVALPLNLLRERFGLIIYKSAYEVATNLVLSKETEYLKYSEIRGLPEWYGFLSAGGGEVLVINQRNTKGVFFYTFRGTPDGKAGFLKIKQGKIDDFRKHFLGVGELKWLGEDWYYITVG